MRFLLIIAILAGALYGQVSASDVAFYYRDIPFDAISDNAIRVSLNDIGLYEQTELHVGNTCLRSEQPNELVWEVGEVDAPATCVAMLFTASGADMPERVALIVLNLLDMPAYSWEGTALQIRTVSGEPLYFFMQGTNRAREYSLEDGRRFSGEAYSVKNEGSYPVEIVRIGNESLLQATLGFPPKYYLENDTAQQVVELQEVMLPLVLEPGQSVTVVLAFRNLDVLGHDRQDATIHARLLPALVIRQLDTDAVFAFRLPGGTYVTNSMVLP